MPKRLVLENEFVHMWFYPGTGIVHHQFRKFIWGDAFREVLNEGLKVFAREGATKWLSDDRESSALSKADTDWSMTDWFPRISALGWKYWAIVLPQSVLGEMNIKRFINAYTEQGLTVQVFVDPVPALAWLQAVGPKPAEAPAEGLRQAAATARQVAASPQPASGTKVQTAASLQSTPDRKPQTAVSQQPGKGTKVQTAVSQQPGKGTKVQTAVSQQPSNGTKVQTALSQQPSNGTKVQTAVSLEPTSGNQRQVASGKRQG